MWIISLIVLTSITDGLQLLGKSDARRIFPSSKTSSHFQIFKFDPSAYDENLETDEVALKKHHLLLPAQFEGEKQQNLPTSSGYKNPFFIPSWHPTDNAFAASELLSFITNPIPEHPYYGSPLPIYIKDNPVVLKQSKIPIFSAKESKPLKKGNIYYFSPPSSHQKIWSQTTDETKKYDPYGMFQASVNHDTRTDPYMTPLLVGLPKNDDVQFELVHSEPYFYDDVQFGPLQREPNFNEDVQFGPVQSELNFNDDVQFGLLQGEPNFNEESIPRGNAQPFQNPRINGHSTDRDASSLAQYLKQEERKNKHKRKSLSDILAASSSKSSKIKPKASKEKQTRKKASDTLKKSEKSSKDALSLTQFLLEEEIRNKHKRKSLSDILASGTSFFSVQEEAKDFLPEDSGSHNETSSEDLHKSKNFQRDSSGTNSDLPVLTPSSIFDSDTITDKSSIPLQISRETRNEENKFDYILDLFSFLDENNTNNSSSTTDMSSNRDINKDDIKSFLEKYEDIDLDEGLANLQLESQIAKEHDSLYLASEESFDYNFSDYFDYFAPESSEVNTDSLTFTTYKLDDGIGYEQNESETVFHDVMLKPSSAESPATINKKNDNLRSIMLPSNSTLENDNTPETKNLPNKENLPTNKGYKKDNNTNASKYLNEDDYYESDDEIDYELFDDYDYLQQTEEWQEFLEHMASLNNSDGDEKYLNQEKIKKLSQEKKDTLNEEELQNEKIKLEKQNKRLQHGKDQTKILGITNESSAEYVVNNEKELFTNEQKITNKKIEDNLMPLVDPIMLNRKVLHTILISTENNTNNGSDLLSERKTPATSRNGRGNENIDGKTKETEPKPTSRFRTQVSSLFNKRRMQRANQRIKSPQITKNVFEKHPVEDVSSESGTDKNSSSEIQRESQKHSGNAQKSQISNTDEAKKSKISLRRQLFLDRIKYLKEKRTKSNKAGIVTPKDDSKANSSSNNSFSSSPIIQKTRSFRLIGSDPFLNRPASIADSVAILRRRGGFRPSISKQEEIPIPNQDDEKEIKIRTQVITTHEPRNFSLVNSISTETPAVVIVPSFPANVAHPNNPVKSQDFDSSQSYSLNVTKAPLSPYEEYLERRKKILASRDEKESFQQERNNPIYKISQYSHQSTPNIFLEPRPVDVLDMPVPLEVDPLTKGSKVSSIDYSPFHENPYYPPRSEDTKTKTEPVNVKGFDDILEYINLRKRTHQLDLIRKENLQRESLQNLKEVVKQVSNVSDFPQLSILNTFSHFDVVDDKEKLYMKSQYVYDHSDYEDRMPVNSHQSSQFTDNSPIIPLNPSYYYRSVNFPKSNFRTKRSPEKMSHEKNPGKETSTTSKKKLLHSTTSVPLTKIIPEKISIGKNKEDTTKQIPRKNDCQNNCNTTVTITKSTTSTNVGSEKDSPRATELTPDMSKSVKEVSKLMSPENEVNSKNESTTSTLKSSAQAKPIPSPDLSKKKKAMFVRAPDPKVASEKNVTVNNGTLSSKNKNETVTETVLSSNFSSSSIETDPLLKTNISAVSNVTLNNTEDENKINIGKPINITELESIPNVTKTLKSLLLLKTGIHTKQREDINVENATVHSRNVGNEVVRERIRLLRLLKKHKTSLENDFHTKESNLSYLRINSPVTLSQILNGEVKIGNKEREELEDIVNAASFEEKENEKRKNVSKSLIDTKSPSSFSKYGDISDNIDSLPPMRVVSEEERSANLKKYLKIYEYCLSREDMPHAGEMSKTVLQHICKYIKLKSGRDTTESNYESLRENASLLSIPQANPYRLDSDEDDGYYDKDYDADEDDYYDTFPLRKISDREPHSYSDEVVYDEPIEYSRIEDKRFYNDGSTLSSQIHPYSKERLHTSHEQLYRDVSFQEDNNNEGVRQIQHIKLNQNPKAQFLKEDQVLSHKIPLNKDFSVSDVPVINKDQLLYLYQQYLNKQQEDKKTDPDYDDIPRGHSKLPKEQLLNLKKIIPDHRQNVPLALQNFRSDQDNQRYLKDHLGNEEVYDLKSNPGHAEKDSAHFLLGDLSKEHEAQNPPRYLQTQEHISFSEDDIHERFNRKPPKGYLKEDSEKIFTEKFPALSLRNEAPVVRIENRFPNSRDYRPVKDRESIFHQRPSRNEEIGRKPTVDTLRDWDQFLFQQTSPTLKLNKDHTSITSQNHQISEKFGPSDKRVTGIDQEFYLGTGSKRKGQIGQQTNEGSFRIIHNPAQSSSHHWYDLKFEGSNHRSNTDDIYQDSSKSGHPTTEIPVSDMNANSHKKQGNSVTETHPKLQVFLHNKDKNPQGNDEIEKVNRFIVQEDNINKNRKVVHKSGKDRVDQGTKQIHILHEQSTHLSLPHSQHFSQSSDYIPLSQSELNSPNKPAIRSSVIKPDFGNLLQPLIKKHSSLEGIFNASKNKAQNNEKKGNPQNFNSPNFRLLSEDVIQGKADPQTAFKTTQTHGRFPMNLHRKFIQSGVAKSRLKDASSDGLFQLNTKFLKGNLKEEDKSLMNSKNSQNKEFELITYSDNAQSGQKSRGITVGTPFGDVDQDGIPGESGKDYPRLTTIPKTSFSCHPYRLRPEAFYPDPEAKCQIYHKCSGSKKRTFLCPLGTIFDAVGTACKPWHKARCHS